MDLQILFEDEYFIAVLKPSGLLVQKDSKSDSDSLYDIVKHRLAGGFCGIVHRLDRFTEGIMVFAKTSRAAASLSAQIRKHEPEKRYQAVCEGIFPEKTGRLTHYIRKKDLVAVVHSSPRPDAKKAELEYSIVEERNGRSLLDIRLITGRYNQIRAQLAYVRHPVAGDYKYQKSTEKISAIALAAVEFSFTHPFTSEEIRLEHKWDHSHWIGLP